MNAELELLARLRARVDDLHPPAELRDAVLRSLPDRAMVTARRRTPGVLAGFGWGLAAATALLLPLLLLRGGDDDSRRTALAPVVRDLQAIARARALNLVVYEREKARLHREFTGKWALIADMPAQRVTGEGGSSALTTADSLDALPPTPTATHRFVFRVGDEGDVTTFASSWYAPRFAGPALAQALEPRGTPERAADGPAFYRFLDFQDATPFPRARLRISAPGEPSPRPVEGREEVFVGSVGPTLMLTPEDDTDLRLERWEVPGTETVMDVRCRRVLVTVSMPASGGDGTVVACVPDVPYVALVDLSRARGRFWEWADTLRADLRLSRIVGVPDSAASSHWLVFGNDRVLGDGASPETALAAADSLRDVVYHRYVLPWPRPEPPTPEGPPVPGEDVVVEVGGLRFEGEASPDAIRGGGPSGGAGAWSEVPTVFVPAIGETDWVRAGLHRAEDGVDPILDQEVPSRPGSDFVSRSPPPSGAVLRAAYARVSVAPRGDPSAKRERFLRILTYVVPR